MGREGSRQARFSHLPPAVHTQTLNSRGSKGVVKTPGSLVIHQISLRTGGLSISLVPHCLQGLDSWETFCRCSAFLLKCKIWSLLKIWKITKKYMQWVHVSWHKLKCLQYNFIFHNTIGFLTSFLSWKWNLLYFQAPAFQVLDWNPVQFRFAIMLLLMRLEEAWSAEGEIYANTDFVKVKRYLLLPWHLLPGSLSHVVF